MLHKPERAKPTEVVEWNDGESHRRLDDLATEEPLEIRVNGTPLTVTMRTPGDDVDLAAGFLFTEGVISSAADIESLAHGATSDGQTSGNIVDARLRSDAGIDILRVQRQFVASSSCGICGKTSIEAIRARDLHPLNSGLRIDAAVLTSLPDALRPAQAVFDRTGALHAAALCDAAGTLLLVREDVGRHNAVDKVVGRALLDGRPLLSESLLLVSGRAGFEIVQKAVAAGIPVVASVSAPSSLAVQCARDFGLTLVGFLRGNRFVVYAGEKRLSLTC